MTIHGMRLNRHHYLAVLWALMLVPTLLWWKDSILWVAAMSLYANVASHWSAAEGANAAKEAGKS